MRSTPRRLDAYIRVSSVRGREGEKFTSPTDQERAIRQWADLYGHHVTEDGPDGNGAWHELDVSGGTMDRPKLNEILARIDAGESDGIVVYRLDRFGRTLVGALQIIERLHEDGKLFASVMDNFDITTENGRLVLRIMLSLGQYERERIQTTWRTARDNAVARGWHISATPPFGYQREQLTNSSGEQYLGRLVVDEQEGPLVTELFKRRADGETWGQVTRWLNRSGASPRRGGGWTVSTVGGIVENTVYLGVARGGVKGAPENPGAHKPLTDSATWHAAQRKGKAPKRAAKGTTHPVLGAGLVRCAGCRYMAAPTGHLAGKFSADGSGGLNFNYLCSRLGRSDDCVAPAIAAACRDDGSPTVDDVIAERVLARLDAEPSGFRAFDEAADDLPELEEDWAQAQARAEECATDFALEEEIGTGAWRKRCAALNRIAEEKLEQLTHARRQHAAELELGRSGRVLADDWRASRLSLDEKRKVTANMVQAIFLRKADGRRRWSGRLTDAKRAAYVESLRSRVHIVWADDAPVDVPRPGRRGYEPQPFEFPGR